MLATPVAVTGRPPVVSIMLFMVVALAVAGGVLYVTKAREDRARADERREARRGPREGHRDPHQDEGRDGGSTEPA